MQVFTDTISIHPQFLNKNALSHVTEKILENKSKINSDGSIFIIKRINIKKHSNKILNNGYALFTVTYDAYGHVPKKDSIIRATILSQFYNGILLSDDMFNIIIPSQTMKNYKFNGTVFCNDSISLAVGDTCDVMIMDMRVDKNKINCVGKLVE